MSTRMISFTICFVYFIAVDVFCVKTTDRCIARPPVPPPYDYPKCSPMKCARKRMNDHQLPTELEPMLNQSKSLSIQRRKLQQQYNLLDLKYQKIRDLIRIKIVSEDSMRWEPEQWTPLGSPEVEGLNESYDFKLPLSRRKVVKVAKAETVSPLNVHRTDPMVTLFSAMAQVQQHMDCVKWVAQRNIREKDELDEKINRILRKCSNSNGKPNEGVRSYRLKCVDAETSSEMDEMEVNEETACIPLQDAAKPELHSLSNGHRVHKVTRFRVPIQVQYGNASWPSAAKSTVL